LLDRFPDLGYHTTRCLSPGWRDNGEFEAGEKGRASLDGGLRMRIVMIGPFGLRPLGTMSARALPLALALVRRGHQVTVLVPPWQNPEDAGRSWDEGGVTVENIELPPGVPGLFHLLTALRLVRRALALRPGVVHLFKPKAYSGLAHWLLARLPLPRRPHLVVDTDDWEGPGGWNEIGDYTPAQRRFFAWQERWGLRHAGAVTVVSRTLEGLVWALGVAPQRVFYVPNGLKDWNLASDIRRPAGDASEPVILLYTRFFEFPFSRVIDVLRRVRSDVPDACLLVVGKGLFGEEARLGDLALQAGLADAISYAGWVDIKALPGTFARATVAIYPLDDTLLNRAKGVAKLLDLLAAGVPVVAEAVGQSREFIRHGETGWLVPSGDVAAFAAGVVRLLLDAPLREHLSQAAARDVRQNLAWDHLAETVERAYLSCEVNG
jgi:glycosyltransferase involved in cell wall biosynthesis